MCLLFNTLKKNTTHLKAKSLTRQERYGEADSRCCRPSNLAECVVWRRWRHVLWQRPPAQMDYLYQIIDVENARAKLLPFCFVTWLVRASLLNLVAIFTLLLRERTRSPRLTLFVPGFKWQGVSGSWSLKMGSDGGVPNSNLGLATGHESDDVK